MQKISIIAMSFILFLMSTLAYSADQCTTWGCVSTISELYTKANGYVYVGTPFDETNANCTPHQGVYFVLDAALPGTDKVYSSLLAAYMSGKKIQVRIVEGSSNCEINYVRFQVDF